jgi:hypothetical protein
MDFLTQARWTNETTRNDVSEMGKRSPSVSLVSIDLPGFGRVGPLTASGRRFRSCSHYVMYHV